MKEQTQYTGAVSGRAPLTSPPPPSQLDLAHECLDRDLTTLHEMVLSLERQLDKSLRSTHNPSIEKDGELPEGTSGYVNTVRDLILRVRVLQSGIHSIIDRLEV